MRGAGRGVLGALAGLLLGLFLGLDLFVLGVVTLDSPVISVLAAAGLVAGAALGLRAARAGSRVAAEASATAPERQQVPTL